MLDTRELAWAAGLFEGEGCISIHKTPTRYGTYTYPRLRVVMTDEDSIRRFHSAVGVGRIFGPYRPPSRSTRKPIWEWIVTSFEDNQAVIAMLWFGLGARRRLRAREVLSTPTKED